MLNPLQGILVNKMLGNGYKVELEENLDKCVEAHVVKAIKKQRTSV